MRKINEYLEDFDLLMLMGRHEKSFSEGDFVDDLTDIQYVLSLMSKILLEAEENDDSLVDIQEIIEDMRHLITFRTMEVQ